ncbi:MAG: MBL fold metallo-hydrolase [Clostridiales bacterium]|nr:MBL fold metallo-hydrolase [Clostridiales bacterium]
MKKTYVTKMPNHIGAFLKASKCFADLGINITRVSYNKAVDSHTLFIEVDGEESQFEKANEKLKEIGYLSNGEENTKIVLIEFRLKDEPGSVTNVLELISKFNFNISYISSQENGSDYQYFKMGLYVNNTNDLTQFLSQAEKLCEVKVIDYNNTEKVFDNSIFYNSYVDGLVKTMGLSNKKKEDLLVNVNLAMQTLDEQGLSPYKTFDSISKFAELLAESKGNNFNPRVTVHELTEKTKITLIEPDCGSNTAIIESDGQRVFVDSGYACYKKEMLDLIKRLIPDFKSKKESLVITHADVDHCGLLNEFDQVIVSKRSFESLSAEADKTAGFRERNYLHLPYVNICKILTDYETVDKSKLCPMWNKSSLTAPIEQIGFYSVGELNFEVYEGKGGHLSGEILLIDYEHKVAFTGDVFINLTGLTKKQAEYNQYAPILMTSVDTDAKLCAKERSALLQRLGAGTWNIFGGHGGMKEYFPQATK